MQNILAYVTRENALHRILQKIYKKQKKYLVIKAK